MATEPALPPGVIAADTVTKLPSEARGSVLVSGSHGGRYPAYLAVQAGVKAVILNDAGVGLRGAGVACLDYCAALGIVAATVASASCRIGDTADMLARGAISGVNSQAAALDVAPGMACLEAAARLAAAACHAVDPPPFGEARAVLARPVRRVILIDSASLVLPEDAGQIVVTGSHGGLLGGDPAAALRVQAFAAIFNDAGVGADEAGIHRLPALDARGIAAFTVAASTACIGSAQSSYEEGMISAANGAARAMGAEPAMPARAVIDAWSSGGGGMPG